MSTCEGALMYGCVSYRWFLNWKSGPVKGFREVFEGIPDPSAKQNHAYFFFRFCHFFCEIPDTLTSSASKNHSN